jgi:hypothetical protein
MSRPNRSRQKRRNTARKRAAKKARRLEARLERAMGVERVVDVQALVRDELSLALARALDNEYVNR